MPLRSQILGDGVTINSATYSGGALQAATFDTGAGSSFGSNILTFTDGVIFSTGTATSVAGPNTVSNFTVNAPGIDGDPQFNALAGNSTFDASFIVISFTPDVPPGATAGDIGRMTMEIVFGSDEYNEFVYGGVNDTLAVIVNGVNQAQVPNGLAIGIDTINNAAVFNPGFGSPALDPNPEHVAAGFESANASLYVNNETNAFNTQMDGFTITLPVTFDVIVGQVNTIKIGIADTGDAAWDSWMFVKADSGQTVIVAENDTVTTPTNVPFNIDVTANDYDLQGDTLTVTHILGQPVSPGDTVTLASGVEVTVELDGSLTVEGDGTNTANDAFTYSITDGNGGTSTAFVNVNITEPVANTPPVGVDDTISVTEDTASGPVNILGNDTNAQGDPLTISAAAMDTNGDGNPDTLVLGTPTLISDSFSNTIGTVTVASNGDVTFDPATDYTGLVPDLTYTPNDGTGDGMAATVTFGPIVAVPEAPSGTDNTITIDEDSTYALTVADFGFSDPDGDAFDHIEITTLPANGTLLLNGVPVSVGDEIWVGDVTAGLLTFVPVADGNGVAYTNFQFVVCDDSAPSLYTETFGTGTGRASFASASLTGTTTYVYDGSGTIDDGDYALVSALNPHLASGGTPSIFPAMTLHKPIIPVMQTAGSWLSTPLSMPENFIARVLQLPTLATIRSQLRWAMRTPLQSSRT